MTDKTDTKNGFQKLFLDVKDLVDLKIDYLQVGLVEKLTRLISKLLILIASLIFGMAVLFYLLFALAYAIAPVVGFTASFALVAGIFFLLMVIVLAFRNRLIIRPLLKFMVGLFYDETKNLKEDEDDAEAV